MNSIQKLAAIAMLSGLGGAQAQTVVTNPGVTLAVSDIRDVYVGEKQFAGSIKLVPVDNGSVRDQFLAAIVKVDAGKYNSIWAKKGFREGLTPPASKATDSEVVDFVRKTPGAVGYVGDASKATGVNVVK